MSTQPGHRTLDLIKFSDETDIGIVADEAFIVIKIDEHKAAYRAGIRENDVLKSFRFNPLDTTTLPLVLRKLDSLDQIPAERAFSVCVALGGRNLDPRTLARKVDATRVKSSIRTKGGSAQDYDRQLLEWDLSVYKPEALVVDRTSVSQPRKRRRRATVNCDVPPQRKVPKRAAHQASRRQYRQGEDSTEDEDDDDYKVPKKRTAHQASGRQSRQREDSTGDEGDDEDEEDFVLLEDSEVARASKPLAKTPQPVQASAPFPSSETKSTMSETVVDTTQDVGAELEQLRDEVDALKQELAEEKADRQQKAQAIDDKLNRFAYLFTEQAERKLLLEGEVNALKLQLAEQAEIQRQVEVSLQAQTTVHNDTTILKKEVACLVAKQQAAQELTEAKLHELDVERGQMTMMRALVDDFTMKMAAIRGERPAPGAAGAEK